MSELKSCPDGGHCQNEDLIDELRARVTELEQRNAHQAATIEQAEKLLEEAYDAIYDDDPDLLRRITEFLRPAGCED